MANNINVKLSSEEYGTLSKMIGDLDKYMGEHNLIMLVSDGKAHVFKKAGKNVVIDNEEDGEGFSPDANEVQVNDDDMSVFMLSAGTYNPRTQSAFLVDKESV